MNQYTRLKVRVLKGQKELLGQGLVKGLKEENAFKELLLYQMIPTTIIK